jgi:Tol biopolymer transport system component
MIATILQRVAVAALAAAALAHSDAQPATGYTLALVDVEGNETVLGDLPPSVYAPRVSPDGRRVAFETRDRSGPDGARLWTADLNDLANRKPLSSVAGPINWAPMWTLDGERLVFIVSGGGPDAIYWGRADGTGDAEHLIDTRAGEGWVGGGAQLRFLTLKGNGDYGIAFLDMASRKVTPVVDLPGSAQHSSAVSPDGRWLAYASNETGRYEVWIEPLPRTGERHQVTREGGSHPLWLPDGKSLYFDRDHRLYRLAIDTANLAAPAAVTALPIAGFEQAEYRRQFDLMPDGRSFLVLLPKR